MQSSNHQKLIIIALAGVGVLISACLIVAVLALYKNATQAPGAGKKAEAGYALCAPVIEALTRYHATERNYPAALDTLVPDYLAEIPAPEDGYPLEYTTEGASYRLQFRYTGPGMNKCAYRPETGWECHGYY